METLSRASSGRWSERRVDICAASLPAPHLIAGPGSSCGVSCLEPAVLKRHPLFSTRRSGGQVGIKKRGANHALTKALTFPPLVVASSSERLEERQALRGSPSAFIVLPPLSPAASEPKSTRQALARWKPHVAGARTKTENSEALWRSCGGAPGCCDAPVRLCVCGRGAETTLGLGEGLQVQEGCSLPVRMFTSRLDP